MIDNVVFVPVVLVYIVTLFIYSLVGVNSRFADITCRGVFHLTSAGKVSARLCPLRQMIAWTGQWSKQKEGCLD